MVINLHTNFNLKEIRQLLREKRRAISSKERKIAAQAIKNKALSLRYVSDSSKLAVFLPFDGELDTRPLIEELWRQKKQLYLPALDPISNTHLLFIHYKPNDTLILNRYNIKEPKFSPHSLTSLSQLNVIFVPLVAFDSQGNRLGMGGGFYDRTLQKLNASANLQSNLPKLIGLAYDCQKIDNIQKKSWDIQLSEVITPNMHYQFQ